MAHPSTLSLTLSADVLRLPYPAATRLVLAGIVSLHAANRGCCDCSDAHLAARLTISKDTASVAVQLLEKEGLLVKQVVRERTGFYRTLAPVAIAITAKAATNPYPEFPGSRKTQVPGKTPLPYPEIPATPTRKLPPALPGNSGSNTTLNTTEKLQETSSATADAASAGVFENNVFLAPLAKQLVPPVAPPPHSVLEAGPTFKEFWEAYAKKVDRHKCAQRWKALKPAERSAALAATIRYVESTSDRKYRKNPLTWLNGRNWEDEEMPDQTSRPSNVAPPPPARAATSLAKTAAQSWR
jgi:hypothetical protein